MIYQMAKDMRTALHGRKWPVAIWYGPQRLDNKAHTSMRVQISRDAVDGDKIVGHVGSFQNPRKSAMRWLGVVAVLSVQSPKAGAMHNEHEHLCDDLVDALTCEICDWCTAAKSMVEWVEARYISEEEQSGAELGSGAHYIMRFRIARGVYTKDFDGGILPTAELTGFESEIHLTVDGQREEVI